MKDELPVLEYDARVTAKPTAWDHPAVIMSALGWFAGLCLGMDVAKFMLFGFDADENWTFDAGHAKSRCLAEFRLRSRFFNT